MDISPINLAKLLLPKTPLILKTAVWHSLSWSKNSKKQDLYTELSVAILRSFLVPKESLGKTQNMGLKDPGVKGDMWIAKQTLAGEGQTDVRDALVEAIKSLGDGTETYTLPEVRDVSGEWTGYRKDVAKDAPLPDIPEQEKYNQLMAEVESPVTILYFHGGAFFLMDPCSHRRPTSLLAKLTKGRAFSVRYRLAPQNPFPAAVLDALVAYLSLLSPPPGSLHEAIPAKNIVFAGDSAGGNLAISLLQTILTLQRSSRTIHFHGQDIKLDVPAGVALNSPWADISRSLPSIHTNAHLDYLNPPSATGTFGAPPADSIWPTTPPRVEIYCPASVLIHPLVSPLATPTDLWRGAPPVYMCLGNEGLEDEISVLARRLHSAGVTVDFDGYEGMPHCFAMIFMTSVASRECFRRWAGFIVDAVAGKVDENEDGRWMRPFYDPPAYRYVKLERVTELADEEIEERLQAARKKTIEREEALLQEHRGKEVPKAHL